MNNKSQIFFIHGGGTHKTREDFAKCVQEQFTVSLEKKIKWSGDYLENKLGDDFQIIMPKMPLKEDARYDEWKIYFEKYIPLLSDNIILIGNSLGGIFLAKYLSENIFPKKINSIYFVAPPFDNSLPGEDLVGGFELQSDLSLLGKNCSTINFLFSKDDPVVPVEHAKNYEEKLPNANFIYYESMNGHFQVEEFPEIVEMILTSYK